MISIFRRKADPELLLAPAAVAVESRLSDVSDRRASNALRELLNDTRTLTGLTVFHIGMGTFLLACQQTVALVGAVGFAGLALFCALEARRAEHEIIHREGMTRTTQAMANDAFVESERENYALRNEHAALYRTVLQQQQIIRFLSAGEVSAAGTGNKEPAAEVIFMNGVIRRDY